MKHNHNGQLEQTRKKKIAYVLGSFPMLTTTFIDREILEAKRIQTNLVMLAIRPGAVTQIRPEVKRLAEETIYLLPVPWLKFLLANLHFGITRFCTYFATLLYLLTRPHKTIVSRGKTIAHFGEGVWAAALLKPEHIDHIHAHFADRAAVVALVASRLLRVPYSLTAHANDIYASPVLLSEKVAHAKFVTTCTGYNKAFLERATGRPIELVYHGLDLTRIESGVSPSLNGQSPLILSVGQLKGKKGFAYLIKACQLLKNRGYDFRGEIIGEGPNRKNLETLIADLKLQDTVTLRGALSNAEVMARYSQATLFVLPCVVAKDGDRDGIPNVLLEAMINRVPVISTELSGIPELVENNVTGLLVNSGDSESLANAIVRLLNDVELRQKLGQMGYQRVVERFDIKKNINRLIELIEA
jgi:glycosyltransferase involved in cell wall biosynthesis